MSASYAPKNAAEKAYFDMLWDVANNRSVGGDPTVELSGLAAVTFFQRSGVDKGFLKNIWSLSTPTATMNAPQFFTALRYITMIQNGEIPISPERLIKTLHDDLGLPKFSGIDLPAAPKPAATIAQPSVPAPPIAGAAPMFSITPAEHGKYHSLFLTYDADRDGFLTNEEAVVILRQSGLDSLTLERIWAMADEDRDRRLTSKEFCVAFHIIVCVTKRGQPMPDSLPPALLNFLKLAPPVPPDSNAAPIAAPAPLPSSAAPALSHVPAPLPEAVKISKADKISAEFDLIDSTPVSNAPLPSSNPSYPPASGARPASSVPSVSATSAREEDVIDAVDGMKAAARKALAAQSQAVESSERTYSSLAALRQKLATEKISLEATVANAVAANNETNAKLEQVVGEIAKYQEQLQELRGRFSSLAAGQVDGQEKLAKASAEKARLLKDIDDTLKQLNEVSQGNAQYSSKLADGSAELSKVTEQNKAISAKRQSAEAESIAVAQENSTLQSILSSLKSELSSANQQRSVLAARVQSTQALLQDEKAILEKNRSSLAQSEVKLKVLKEEKQHLLSELSSVSASPLVIPAKAVEESVFSSDAFGQVASGDDDPFGGLGTDDAQSAAALNTYVAFGDDLDSPVSPMATPPASAPTSVFAPAPSQPEPSMPTPVLPDSAFDDFSSDPFSDMGAPPQAPSDNAFGDIAFDAAPTDSAFGDIAFDTAPAPSAGGFDDFGFEDNFAAPAAPAAPVPEPNPQPSAFDDFGGDAFSSPATDLAANFSTTPALEQTAFPAPIDSSSKTTIDFDEFGFSSPASIDFPSVAPPAKKGDDGFNAFTAPPADFEFSAPAGDLGFDAAAFGDFSAPAAGAFDAFGDVLAVASSGMESFSESAPFGEEEPDPFS